MAIKCIQKMREADFYWIIICLYIDEFFINKLIYMWSKMCSEIMVKVINKETVTPSSSTLHHLMTSNLSVFDHFVPDLYTPLLLFYPNNSTTDHKINTVDHHHSMITERSKLLKTSLSETLNRFYPFAGRIFSHNNILSICCNDNGAAFIQTRVNCPISKVLEKPHPQILNQLLPIDIESTFESTGYLLLVQANFFECGGLAIGVSISHQIADGFTRGTFIRSWAAMGLGSDVASLPAAEFGVSASLYPPQDLITNSLPTSMKSVNNEACVKRRFVFDASNIVRLKSKATSATVPNPTRVEVVSALIWKCAMEASTSNLGFTRPANLHLATNMRKVLEHPTLMGNIVAPVLVKTQETEATLQSLVALLREAIEEFKVKYSNRDSRDDICQHLNESMDIMGKNDINNYLCSSWCRFGFYEANFGWGNPSWVTHPGIPINNVIVLIETKDGEGIEAILSFKGEDMTVIETNKELLAYGSLNPTVI